MNIYDNFTKEQLIEKIEYLYKEIDKLHNALEGKITEFRSEEVEKVKEELETINNWLKEEYGISYTELNEEIKRLKENYMILQNASDERENELIAESTKWESKFYDEAKKVDKAIEYIRQLEFESEELYDISEIARLELLDILKGSDKE